MYNLSYCNPTITNCTFIGNSTTAGHGGGMYNISYCDPTVTGCTFTNNAADDSGGGMCNYESSPTVTNCTFTGNSAIGGGGGMSNWPNCNSTVTNCTFTGNSAGSSGGGMFNWDSNPTITNCILWNDTPDEISDVVCSPIVSYCDVQGGYSGTGNIDADPLFADPGAEDYHLTGLSPCIDVGDNSAPELPPTDFEGDLRIIDGNLDTTDIVDMGCDEHFIQCIYVPDDLSTIQGAIDVSIDTCAIIVRAGHTLRTSTSWERPLH
jgi:hypothetical protein